jgi:hypothetical protein
VRCQGGYRAGIAASLPKAAGHTVTAIDDFAAQEPPAWPSQQHRGALRRTRHAGINAPVASSKFVSKQLN